MKLLLHLTLVTTTIFGFAFGAPKQDRIRKLPGLNQTLSFKQYSGYLNGENGVKLHYWYDI